MTLFRRSVVPLLFLLCLSSCSPGKESGAVAPTLPTASITLGGRRIQVECATTREARERGLRFRSLLGADQGMLFCWADDALRAFSMRETVIPLSVAFCKADGTVIEIRSCRPLDKEGPSSGDKFRYALALTDGWFAEHDVRAGAKIEWGPEVTALRPEGEGPLRIDLQVAGHSVVTEVVYTEKARETGLMNRDALDAEAGMLFVYAKDRPLSFWMKDTRLPIAIAFLSEAGVIDEIRKMKPYDLTRINARKPARFALEVNADWFDRHQVNVGDAVTLPQQVLGLPADP
ncbi:MAG: DUF192 domain-containing protein [Planctomycetes bacterium]|nr:DUF192 domain-containing protein [Planctomycetota bacterium]